MVEYVDVPKEVTEELRHYKENGETLLRVIRYKDSYVSEAMHWIVHEEPRSRSEDRLLAVVNAWENLN